jgi:hypothetical protein
MPILTAGKIELLYEDGFVRYFKVSDLEVLRMIYFALRDENWDTQKPWIENERVEIGADSFRIQYRCLNKKNDRSILSWDVSIEGNSDSTITFEIDGTILEDLSKNRAGFCVLHPVGEHVLGQPVELTHPEGNKTSSNFPVRIDPRNPFKNIRQMRWFTNEMWFRLDFEGDIFETEDQRNWTDASFKTFCTPRDLPIPVSLKKGERIQQKVTFTPESKIKIGSNNPLANDSPQRNQQFKLPILGIGASRVEITDTIAEHFKHLPFSIYRITIRFSDPNWVSRFSFDCVNAIKLNLKPEVILHLTDNYKDELEAFVLLCLQNRLTLFSVLLLHENKPATPQYIIDYAPFIVKQLPGVKFGAGTDYYFRELNVNRFDPKGLDFISYGIQPQEHLFDDRSVMETLETQGETVISAKDIYPGLEMHVSPVTFKKRKKDDEPSAMAAQYDARLHTDFGAKWTMGSVASLSDAGASIITYFEVMGPLGIVSELGALNAVGGAFKKLAPTSV